ncbi:Hypothetical protein PMM1984 [Prochlorococcus marinus subsp. pastoris str. CCMP1986]|uniref:Uncharacterized protein n=1 Tax=Prochlorococcus marinus subsp. pastoris (strain CCMP1986 / NIES-2087 / MED4) TaxID=59919 RepID=A8WIK1_PROMP|nr:hypothetical protein PROCH_0637 [Prochlorococcus marinus str. EQPAC1]CAP16489.1 Hypothetical protein PMM1984 [Prochlorococcus marinus subsp. pastoris str. CCMP1986]
MTYSLIVLATLILVFLYWLVTKTLKEGKEALKEMSKNTK